MESQELLSQESALADQLQELLTAGQRHVPTRYILKGINHYYDGGCHIAVADTEENEAFRTIRLNASERNEETLARRLGQLFSQTPLATAQPPSH